MRLLISAITERSIDQQPTSHHPRISTVAASERHRVANEEVCCSAGVEDDVYAVMGGASSNSCGEKSYQSVKSMLGESGKQQITKVA